MVGENNLGADNGKSGVAESGAGNDTSPLYKESIIDNPAALQTWKDAQGPGINEGSNKADNGNGLFHIGVGANEGSNRGDNGNGLSHGVLGAREQSKDEILAETTQSPETLAKLAKNDNFLVRMNVAGNSFTEQKVYEELTSDKDPLVRQVAAGASRPMSEDLQMKFAQDKATNVRYAIATRGDAKEKVLDKLAGDEDFTIRDRVAQNTNTSPTRLAQMLNDPHPLVVESAMNNPHTPKEAVVAAQKAAAEKAAQKAWKPKDDYKSFDELKQDVMQHGSYEMQTALTSLEKSLPDAQILQGLAGQAIDSMTPEARQYVQAVKDLLKLGKQK